MTFAMLGVLLLVGLASAYLAVRIAYAIRLWREPTTRWVRRSPVDRRRRQIAIAVERRRVPRREDDIVRELLAGAPRSRRRHARA